MNAFTRIAASLVLGLGALQASSTAGGRPLAKDGITLDAVFALLRALLFLPARLLGPKP